MEAEGHEIYMHGSVNGYHIIFCYKNSSLMKIKVMTGEAQDMLFFSFA